MVPALPYFFFSAAPGPDSGILALEPKIAPGVFTYLLYQKETLMDSDSVLVLDLVLDVIWSRSWTKAVHSRWFRSLVPVPTLVLALVKMSHHTLPMRLICVLIGKCASYFYLSFYLNLSPRHLFILMPQYIDILLECFQPWNSSGK